VGARRRSRARNARGPPRRGDLFETLFADATCHITACAPLPDGRRAVLASSCGELKLWNLDTDQVAARFQGHTSGVTACVATPDGRRVVSASTDRTLKVWELETGACVLTHRGDARFTAVAATAEGVVAGDASGNVAFLDWPPPPQQRRRRLRRTYRGRS
jgi:WD40 repeat protein